MSEDQYRPSHGSLPPSDDSELPIIGIPTPRIEPESYYYTILAMAGGYVDGVMPDTVYGQAGCNTGFNRQQTADPRLVSIHPQFHRYCPTVPIPPESNPLFAGRHRPLSFRDRTSHQPYLLRNGSSHGTRRTGLLTSPVSYLMVQPAPLPVEPTTSVTDHLLHSAPGRMQREPPIPSPPSRSITDVDAALAFAQASFPEGTPGFFRKQAKLYDVMMAPWKIRNEFEPSPDIILDFSVKENGFWMCGFYVDGRRCDRSMTDRSRQIIEHIRRHIKLEPYVCEGAPCPNSVTGCGKRYSSGDPLKKHRDGNLNGGSICEICGKTLLPGNIIRHRNNSCRETPGHL